ncbi:hydrolase [Vibrio tarriae]|nr:hydrolase [Vibrio tarriae]RBM29179.1 hydrolase [Vibrio tarriae]RBM49346.1 hydrolase [Vibrio tarriae]RBM50295.1 hydrolase [Vibrio tarriae]
MFWLWLLRFVWDRLSGFSKLPLYENYFLVVEIGYQLSCVFILSMVLYL